MPLYSCRVADSRGKVRELMRESASEESLLRELAASGSYVLSVRPSGEGSARARGRRYPRELVSDLTNLLSLTLAAGLSLKDSLELAQAVYARGAGNELATRLLESIRSGSSLHAALESVGPGFPPVYRGLVRVGERIGNLDAVLARLASYLDEERRLRERFGTALIYPAIVLAVAVLAALLLLLLVLPRLRDLFVEISSEAAARVDSLGASLRATLAVAALAALASGALTLAYRRGAGAKARLALDAALLRLPVLGAYALDREMLMLAFSMETMTSAGVAVDEALRESAGASRSPAVAEAVLEVRERVIRGESLSASFSRSSIFPGRLVQWVGIGERVGHVETVFRQLRLYYQQEVEKWTQRLTATIEPALIVLLGGLILLFVLFFVVPILNLYGGAL